MPVTVTYPGIYIEELPSSTHTIVAAPTSITVFVGYSHPFKTRDALGNPNFGKPIRIFSFTDFERWFGGLFASDIFDSTLAYAVNQFFLNGGTDAYVIGLQPQYYDASHNALGPPAPLTQTFGSIQFTALEPADANHPMTITLSNPDTAGDKVDITIAYGSRIEVYRKVTLLTAATDPTFINNRINMISSLVTVAPVGGAGAAYTALSAAVVSAQQPAKQDVTITPPKGVANMFSPADFIDVFKQDRDLDKLPIFNLLVLPGITDNSVLTEAHAFCEYKMAFFIQDPPAQYSADDAGGLPTIDGYAGPTASTPMPTSTNGALYFPYLNIEDPLTASTRALPPSGFVAGIYARTDTNRGVWKAPAGLEASVTNTTGVVDSGRMTDMRQGVLNLLGVNCLRDFPGIGTVVFGARTLVAQNVAFQQWWYVPVRRMALFIEQTLYSNLRWAIFEPNDTPLWVALRTTVESFMLSLYNQGAFQGTTPSQAFQVKCDNTTTTQDDIDQGKVNIIVAFAPLKPAEFVIVKIAQLAGQAQS
jgi:phage tail sheath protein FI